MADHSKDSGKITICMGMEYMLGKTEEDMKAITNLIKSKVMECTCGQMVVGTKATGQMESSMGKASTYYQMDPTRLGTGKMVNVLIGWKSSEITFVCGIIIDCYNVR